MKKELVSRPAPAAISVAYSRSLMATNVAPSATATNSQRRQVRAACARAAAAARAAAQPLVTSTIVFSAASRASSAACPAAKTAGLTARATANAPKKRPKAANSLKMSTQIIGSPGSSSSAPQPPSPLPQSSADIRAPKSRLDPNRYRQDELRTLLPDKLGEIDQTVCAGTKSAATRPATHGSGKQGIRS